MQNRSFAAFIAVLTIVVLLLNLGWSSVARAAEPLDPEKIKAALQTSTQEEEGFIDRAVARTGDGTLPRSIFDSCYLWARKKPRHKFQYFKRALILRAAEAGVNLS
jgi:hypothetical protein